MKNVIPPFSTPDWDGTRAPEKARGDGCAPGTMQGEAEASDPGSLHVATQGVSSSRMSLLTLTHESWCWGRQELRGWGDTGLSLSAEGLELLGPQRALQG